jgi:hypothetical protein
MKARPQAGRRVAAIVYSTAENNGFFSVRCRLIPAAGQPGAALPGSRARSASAAPASSRRASRRGVPRGRGARDPGALRLPSAAECLRFEKESFGALHTMLAGLGEAERAEAWDEIARALAAFEGPDGFVGPCELVVAAGVK